MPLQHLTAEGYELPRHIAIIMDGNGRWAQSRGLPRTIGHRHGLDAVKKVATAARDLGIEYLTLYAFSSENWSRPESEISELFKLLRIFIRRDLAELHRNNVRLKIIGSRFGVPKDVLALLDDAVQLTCENDGQTLIIAFNYGSRHEIAEAAKALAKKVKAGEIDPEDISADLFGEQLDTAEIPDPDLLIRTSGEIRLSNFLLWQLAYTEFVFVDCMWPDFGKKELIQAIDTYCRRCRKFGGLAAEAIT